MWHQFDEINLRLTQIARLYVKFGLYLTERHHRSVCVAALTGLISALTNVLQLPLTFSYIQHIFNVYHEKTLLQNLP